MFLHLRWYGIDVAPYKPVTVSAFLPHEEIEYLKYLRKFRNIDFFTGKTSDQLNIPYSEAIRRAIIHVKEKILKDYRQWAEQTNNEPPPKPSADSLKEHLDLFMNEIVQEHEFLLLIRRDFPRVPRKGNRIRICLRLTKGDLKFLRDITRRPATMGDYLYYLIRAMRGFRMEVRRKNGQLISENKPIRFPIPLIRKYEPHKKMTMAIRMNDYKKIIEFMQGYARKYSEKITKSEIVVLAYHLFKHKSERERNQILLVEKRKGKSRGYLKKISFSFSDIGYYPQKIKPRHRELKAAVYHLLGEKKWESLIDTKSPETR